MGEHDRVDVGDARRVSAVWRHADLIATVQFDMDKLLRYVVIALLVVVGVVVLAVCSEGACQTCAEACCGGARRSQAVRSVDQSCFRTSGDDAVALDGCSRMARSHFGRPSLRLPSIDTGRETVALRI